MKFYPGLNFLSMTQNALLSLIIVLTITRLKRAIIVFFVMILGVTVFYAVIIIVTMERQFTLKKLYNYEIQYL